MHHNHRNLIIPTYDTEVLEKALEEACNGNIQIRHRLEIRNLAISLWYDAELKKQGVTSLMRLTTTILFPKPMKPSVSS